MSFLFGKARERQTQPVQNIPQVTPQTVAGEDTPRKKARRIGRSALIATSPQGVQGTAPTGRRKLLGN